MSQPGGTLLSPGAWGYPNRAPLLHQGFEQDHGSFLPKPLFCRSLRDTGLGSAGWRAPSCQIVLTSPCMMLLTAFFPSQHVRAPPQAANPGEKGFDGQQGEQAGLQPSLQPRCLNLASAASPGGVCGYPQLQRPRGHLHLLHLQPCSLSTRCVFVLSEAAPAPATEDSHQVRLSARVVPGFHPGLPLLKHLPAASPPALLWKGSWAAEPPCCELSAGFQSHPRAGTGLASPRTAQRGPAQGIWGGTWAGERGASDGDVVLGTSEPVWAR